MNKPLIIGITGFAGAGKDKFAELLQNAVESAGRTVARVSSGDLIRQEVRDRNLGDPGDRALLQQVATKHSPDHWLSQALEAAKDRDFLLYPGLRQTPEVDFVHQHHGLVIVSEVPLAIRYKRAQLRARPGDNISLEEFKAQDEAERRGQGGIVQQIELVAKKADAIIYNDGTLEQLEAVAKQLAADLPNNLKSEYKAQSF